MERVIQLIKVFFICMLATTSVACTSMLTNDNADTVEAPVWQITFSDWSANSFNVEVSNEVVGGNSAPDGPVRLTINGLSAHSKLIDGSARFRYAALKLNPLPTDNPDVSIQFGKYQLDVSDSFSTFVTNTSGDHYYQLGYQADTDGNKSLAKTYYEKACQLGEQDACDKTQQAKTSDGNNQAGSPNKSDSAESRLAAYQAKLKEAQEARQARIENEIMRHHYHVSKMNLDAFIAPNSGFYGQLKKDTIYKASFIEVIQKVPGGYIFSSDPQYDEGETGSGFLKSKMPLTPNNLFCPVVRWIGSYRYTGEDGFQHSIPAFHLYEILPPTCMVFNR